MNNGSSPAFGGILLSINGLATSLTLLLQAVVVVRKPTFGAIFRPLAFNGSPQGKAKKRVKSQRNFLLGIHCSSLKIFSSENDITIRVSDSNSVPG